MCNSALTALKSSIKFFPEDTALNQSNHKMHLSPLNATFTGWADIKISSPASGMGEKLSQITLNASTLPSKGFPWDEKNLIHIPSTTGAGSSWSLLSALKRRRRTGVRFYLKVSIHRCNTCIVSSDAGWMLFARRIMPSGEVSFFV